MCRVLLSCFCVLSAPPVPTLFPYTTLFRSGSKSGCSVVTTYGVALIAKLHRVADALHRLVCDTARLPRSFDENLADAIGTRHDLVAPLAHRRQRGIHGAGELRLDLDVTDRPGAVARLEVLDLGGVGIEDVMVHEDRIAFDCPRNVGADPLRIRVHLPHLHRDRVVV